MDKSILVTGGMGFIGSHLVERLVNDGWRVKVYDNLSSGNLTNIQNVSNDVEIICGDILDYEKLSESIKGVGVVSHHAAQLEIFLGINSPEKDLEVNTIGTLNVLKACVNNNIKKLINASSACVYGQSSATLQDEDHPQIPNWEYGVSKLAAERYCQIYSEAHAMEICSLRYSITYGPREWYRRVLTIFIKNALMNKPPVVFGNGEAVRDFLFVGDLVDLHSRILNQEIQGHTILNVGSGTGFTVRDLAEIVCQVSGKQLEPIFEEVPEGCFSKLIPDKKRNSSELKRMVLDCSRAMQLYGWKPVTDIRDGIRSEIEWISKNPNRWQKILSTQW